MTTKHTEGPWKFEGFSFGPEPGGPITVKKIVSPEVFGIASKYAHLLAEVHMTHPNHEADGRLMAAAPELLEALKGVLRVADRKTKEFDAARAAIKKAQGE